MEALDFYFSPGSRYSYLAMCRLPEIEARFNLEFDWIPVSGPRIRALRGVDPFSGKPVSEQYDWGYRRRDAEAWAAYYGVPYQEPRDVHFDGDLLVRAATVAGLLGSKKDYAISLAREVYGHGSWPIEPLLCIQVAADTGLDVGEFGARLRAPECREMVEKRCAQAVDRGVFGVPTFFVGQQLFWGNDRLVLVEHALRQTGADQTDDP